MAKLLILGPTYRRNPSPEPLPAIERYDGIFYKIVRKYMDKVREKGIEILIVTEDLEVVTPDTPLPYKPPKGNHWKTLPPARTERTVKLQTKIAELLKGKHYDEIFIALNKYYRNLLPDLKTHTKRVLSQFSGIGPKAQALKKWILDD